VPDRAIPDTGVSGVVIAIPVTESKITGELEMPVINGSPSTAKRPMSLLTRNAPSRSRLDQDNGYLFPPEREEISINEKVSVIMALAGADYP
jgi:hypothetical protein